jgi:hypothetical protein
MGPDVLCESWPARSACEAVLSALRAHRYQFGSEAELQEGVEIVLEQAGISFVREEQLDARNRIDFLVGDVGIECKIDHSSADLIRQLWRYAGTGKVRELVVVAGKLRLGALPLEIQGVRVHVVFAVRGFG